MSLLNDKEISNISLMFHLYLYRVAIYLNYGNPFEDPSNSVSGFCNILKS